MLVLIYSIKAAKKINLWRPELRKSNQNLDRPTKTGEDVPTHLWPSWYVPNLVTSFDICTNCEPKQSSSLDHDISTCLTESHSTGCWARNLLLPSFFFSRACCTPAVPSFHMIGHPMETSQLTREMSVVFQRTHLHMQTHVTAVTLASRCYHTLYHIHYVYRICAHVLARCLNVEWHT